MGLERRLVNSFCGEETEGQSRVELNGSALLS